MKKVRINVAALVADFARDILSNKTLNSRLDIDGDLVVSVTEFGNFCEDVGILLARSIERVVEIEDKDNAG